MSHHRRANKARKRGPRRPTRVVSLPQPVVLSYDILRRVFEYLSHADLQRASRVHGLWRSIASDVARSRRAPERIVGAVDDASSNFCLGEHLKLKPSFVLVCERYESDDVKRGGCYCRSVVPFGCRIVAVRATGLACEEVYLERPRGLFVCTSLPEIPGLRRRVLVFKATTYDSVVLRKRQIAHLARVLAGNGDAGPRCVFMFANDRGYRVVRKYDVLRQLRHSYKPGQLALIGGQCEDVKTCRALSESCLQKELVWMAVVLRSECLKSWSIVLPVEELASLGGKLRGFRDAIQLRRHSLGYIFANGTSSSRQVFDFEVFKQVFPGVPLVTIYGNRQFGLNTLSPKKEHGMVHSSSIVFMILTYEFTEDEVKSTLL